MKSFTDIEQSKKLTEILPLESADMYYTILTENSKDPSVFIKRKVCRYSVEDGDIPCWSLAALIGVLPEIQGGKPIIYLDDNNITYPHMSDLHTKANNLVDACYELILKLHEHRLI